MLNNQNRGMFLETIINQTIIYYAHNNIALFHKNQLPIKFSGIKKDGLKVILTRGWINKKSTIDYFGVYQGKFIGFEVKSTNNNHFYLNNIKNHQANYLAKITHHQAIGFYLIGFENVNRYFVLGFNTINNWKNKSLNLMEASNYGYEIKWQLPGILNFIPAIDWLMKNIEIIKKMPSRHF